MPRPRFSLRLFLIFFTLIAIALGVWTFVTSTRDQIRRHQEAVKRLKDLGFFMPGAGPTAEPTFYETLARRWIDPTAFSAPYGAMSDSQFFAVGGVDDESERYDSKDIEAILTIVQDLYRAPGIYICVDRLTVKSCRLLARHRNLRALYLDCREIEPGAINELSRLRDLTIFSMPNAFDDEAMSLFRNQINLEGAVLNISKLSQASASSLPKSLKSIVLKGGDGPATSTFVKALANQPQLTSLTLYDCHVDRGTAQAIAALSTLVTLELEGDSVIAPGLWTSLATTKDLKKLSLSAKCRLSEEFNHELAKQLELEILDLAPITFGQDDLNAFGGHPALKELRFLGALQDSQIEGFLRRTPQCSIGMYRLAGDGDAQEKGGGFSSTFYRVVNGKLEVSTSPFQ